MKREEERRVGIDHKDRQVLLIINEPEVCKKLQDTIHGKFGFEVGIATDKEQALEMIQEFPWQYDVVVIYVDLKEKKSGLEFLRALKKNFPEIEVIFVIASTEKDAYSALYEFAFGCFFLPINYEAITYAVKFAREHAKSQRERKMLEKLQELSVAINSAIELQEIQNLACQAAVEILNADHSGLVLFEKGLSKGKVIAEYPETKDFIGTVIQVRGISIEERLVHDGEIINIPDLNTQNDLGKVQLTLKNLKIRSLLIVPVILDNKVIASFSVDMIKEKRVFYSDEVEICKKLANQLAAAMGKARYLKELHILNKIALDSRAFISVDHTIKERDINEKIREMLEIVREHAGALLDVRNFFIAFYEEEKDEYVFPYHEDEKDDVTKFPQEKRRKGMTAYVRRTKKAILADADEIRELVNKGEIKLVGALPRIWLGAPMIVRGKVIGVMAVQNYENENAYDEHDLTVLQIIASQAAIAIDNAQLFKDTRRRIRDLEIVDSIAHTISTKLNTKDLFKTMVVQIAEKLNCIHCTIFLPKKKGRKILLAPQETHGVNSEQIMTRTFKPGEGLAGWVFQHGESIVTPDARNDVRYAPARQRRNLPRSMLIVPVKVGNRTIGVISAQQEKTNWFSEMDRQLVDTLARHAGIAIERALGLNLIQEIGLQIIASVDEEKILQRVVTGAIELTNTISGTLYLVSDVGNSVIKSYRYPSDLDHPPPRMHKKDGYTRLVINSGKMFIVPDLSKDDRVNPELLKHMRAMIAVPLKIGRKVVGVLFLHDKNPRSFIETECSLLEILASQAAIAIYNSRLYKESQRQLTELKALYETSQEIVGEFINIRSLLSKILKRAVEISNADSGQILFRDESTNEAKVVFTHNIDVLKGQRFKPGEGMGSRVFKTGEAIYTNDYYNSPYKAKIFNDPKHQNLFKALAEVPLKWKGEVIGILAMSSKNDFNEESIQLLERFAGPAAIAIAIAREISFRQTLLNNSPNAIVTLDRKGTIKEFNKASENIFGYSMDEVSVRHAINLWGGIEEARRINRLLHESENGTISNIEAFVRSKTGEKIPVLFSGSLLYAEGYGEDQEVIGSIGHIEDQRIVSLKGRTRRLLIALEKINRSEELQELLRTVLYSAIELLEADSGYITLKKIGRFEVVGSHNINQDLIDSINIHMNEGYIGKIINEGFPRTLPKSLASTSNFPISEDGRSALVIPLSSEDKILGAIYLESHINDFFREENELLQIFSAEAAVAINRVQLKEESEELQLLKEIGDEIRKRGKFSEYKDIIVKTSQRLLKSEISTIFLYEKSERSLVRQTWYPKFKELEDIMEIHSGSGSRRGITGRVLNCKEDDFLIYSDEEEIRKAAIPDHIEKYKFLLSFKKNKYKNSSTPIKHFLVVPILGEKGKVFGALRVMNKISKDYTGENPILDEKGFREPEDVKLLKTIASLLSQALVNERKANKLRMLHEVTDELSVKLDIVGIGDYLVKAIVKRFGYSACSMRLVRGDYLELIRGFGFMSNKIKDIILLKDKGLAGRVVETNKVVIAQDIFNDDEKLNGGYLNKDFAKEENFYSACCVPIKGREDETIGVFVIYMRQAPYFFEDYEIKDNFLPIAATCSIALRKVQAVNHLQKLVDILGLVHLETSKYEILRGCMDEMLEIFDAHSAIIYETRKSPDVDQNSLSNSNFEEIYTKNIDYKFDIPDELLLKIKRGGPQTINSDEFQKEWHSIKKRYSQCLIFALEFQDEILGLVMLFTEVGIPFILHEIDRYNLASAISRQLAIAFKNIEITDEIERMRVSQPAIISAQYVSGMIHELASSANRGKAAITYIRGTDEYREIDNINWKIEMSKIESAFDAIGTFTTRALEIKDIARMRFIRTLEFRSINESIRDVLHDCSHEARKKLANINWEYDKAHDQKHAYFDEILIKQAIRNLISNSLKWISDSGGGKITITSGEKEEFIYIRVEDNGAGIDPKIEKSIFEPFFTTSSTGYGIGLFFVKNVVKMHMGEIKLISFKNPTIFEIKISNKLKREAKQNDSLYS